MTRFGALVVGGSGADESEDVRLRPGEALDEPLEMSIGPVWEVKVESARRGAGGLTPKLGVEKLGSAGGFREDAARLLIRATDELGASRRVPGVDAPPALLAVAVPAGLNLLTGCN